MKALHNNIEMIRYQIRLHGFWNPANCITVFRIFAAVAAITFIAMSKFPTFAFLLLFLAAISDKLDGFAASWYNCKTLIGELMDKLADKILVILSTCIIILLSLDILNPINPVPLVLMKWLFTLIIVEILLFILGTAGLSVPLLPTKPTWAGKIKMVVECFFILLWFFAYLRPLGIGFDNPKRLAEICDILLKISVFLGGLSLALYVQRGLKNIRLFGAIEVANPTLELRR